MHRRSLPQICLHCEQNPRLWFAALKPRVHSSLQMISFCQALTSPDNSKPVGQTFIIIKCILHSKKSNDNRTATTTSADLVLASNHTLNKRFTYNLTKERQLKVLSKWLSRDQLVLSLESSLI